MHTVVSLTHTESTQVEDVIALNDAAARQQEGRLAAATLQSAEMEGLRERVEEGKALEAEVFRLREQVARLVAPQVAILASCEVSSLAVPAAEGRPAHARVCRP